MIIIVKLLAANTLITLVAYVILVTHSINPVLPILKLHTVGVLTEILRLCTVFTIIFGTLAILLSCIITVIRKQMIYS